MLLIGDCRETLATLPAGAARCCVTSPPYWGLRDYGHSSQIGLEETPDEYVAQLVGVFREVRRVLADDGTLWLNIGDTYAQSGVGQTGRKDSDRARENCGRGSGRADGADRKRVARSHGIKPKDIVGIPWRVAFALQADGWWLRSDIIWHKPNPMPEGVTDRPTSAHEHVFLLAKSERYYYDAAAIAERATGNSDTRNARNVWTVNPQQYSGAHFATMPLGLAQRCILAGTQAGDIVLDPFLGSGTTAEVAQSLGRGWIGCEAQPDYEPLIRQRTAQQGLGFVQDGRDV